MKRAPGSRLIDLIAPLVPSISREEWRAEWQAELAAAAAERGASSALGMRLRCLGAIPDALWHRRHYQEPIAMSQNLTYALRLMRRRPGFSLVVILTLALGIGGTTAIYSVVNAVLLRSLPFARPDQLYEIFGQPTDGDEMKVGQWTSYPDYQDYQRELHSFSELAAYRTPTATLTVPGGEAHHVVTGLATANLFQVLEVQPPLGRLFRADEEKPGSPAVAVLSHQIWLSRFAGDPAILGRVIQIDGVPYTVIGVMPTGLRFGGVDIWSPLVPGRLEGSRGIHALEVVGRLRPGILPASAGQEAKALAAHLEALYPGDNAKRSVRIEGLQSAAVGQSRAFLLALMGGVTLVLLIICTNVANLFLVRASSRGRELAVRTALGAGRSTLFHQFLTESLLLTILGTVIGLPLAWLGVRTLVRHAPQGLPRVSEIGIDGAALGFMLAVTIGASILFGVVPALYAFRHSIGQGIRQRSPGPRHGRVSRAFVVTQIALAGILVIGAGLLGKSLWRMTQVDLRFNPEHLLVTRIDLPRSRYPAPDQAMTFFSTIEQRLRAEPGVVSVSAAMEHPLSEGWTSSFTLAEDPPPKHGEEPEANVRAVSPGYFRQMGVALIRGHDFDPHDDFNHPGEVIVNRAFVRKHFPDRDPIGKHVVRGPWWTGQPGSWEIVGVVDDEPFRGLTLDANPATYFPHGQVPMNEMYLLIRTSGDPAQLRGLVQRDVWALDRDLPLESIPAMDDLVAEQTAVPRFNVQLIGLFAVVALLLAAMGVYGVLAQMVSQRTAEIGIRIALGAGEGTVLRMVVSQGVRLSMIGVAIGLILALGATRFLESQLYAVGARDPIVYGTVGVVLMVTAILAAYLPARRASRVDPLVALKAD